MQNSGDYSYVNADEQTRRQIEVARENDRRHRENGEVYVPVAGWQMPSAPQEEGTATGSWAIEEHRQGSYARMDFTLIRSYSDYLDSLYGIEAAVTFHLKCSQCTWKTDRTITAEAAKEQNTTPQKLADMCLQRHIEEAHPVSHIAGVDEGDRLDAFLSKLPPEKKHRWF